MPDSPLGSVSLPAISSEEKPRAEVVGALGVHAGTVAASVAYVHLLESRVVPMTVIPDKKTAVAHRRVLSGFEAYPVLQLMWKESGFVADADLAALGMKRSYNPPPLTCHRLAVDLCTSPAQLGAMIKRIRQIVRASIAYGLAEQEQIAPKKFLIRGSELLHDFMIELAALQTSAMIAKSPLLGVT